MPIIENKTTRIFEYNDIKKNISGISDIANFKLSANSNPDKYIIILIKHIKFKVLNSLLLKKGVQLLVLMRLTIMPIINIGNSAKMQTINNMLIILSVKGGNLQKSNAV